MSPLHRTPRSRSSAARLRRLGLAGALCTLLVSGAVLDSGPGGQSPGEEPGPGEPGAIDGPEAVASVMKDVRAASGTAGTEGEQRPAARPGENILLVGLDRRSGMSKAEKDRLHVNGEECNCTDTMMLLHVSERRDRVSVVSIPRDSYVQFAAHREPDDGEDAKPTSHRGKINSAYEHGGPSLAVRTVEQATGVRIDHYAETDFSGFVDTVDEADGAKVCSDKPLRDQNSGLELDRGTHVVDGMNALRYVRARHVSPPGDLGRVRRQQRLVAHMLEALTSDRAQNITGNDAGLYTAAVALRATVRMDDGLTVEKLADLGRGLRGLKPEQTEFATVPMSEFDHRVPEWGSTLKWDERRAEVLFGNLAADRPVTGDARTEPAPGVTPVALPPGEVTVRVEGSGAGAEKVRRGLRENGFDVEESGPDAAQSASPAQDEAAQDEAAQDEAAQSETTQERTEITYDPKREPEALALAAALPEAELRRVEEHPATPVVRLAGDDRAAGTRVAPVVEDRSSVEGAPTTGDHFGCD